MKRFIKSSVGFTLFLLIGFTIIQLLGGGSGSVRLNFGEKHMTVEGPEDFAILVSYENIESIELMELPELGEVLGGGETRDVIYGKRRNDIWGEYELCLTKNSEKCLVLYTADGIKVFSYESTPTTEQLHDAIIELLANKGCEL